MTVVVWLTVAVVVLLAVFVVGLLRSHATIVRALHDAGIHVDPDRSDGGDESVADPVTIGDAPPRIRTVDGVPTPADASGKRARDVSGTTLTGATRTVAVTGRDGATLLAFLTTGCATCSQFWGAFADGVSLPDDTRLVVVTKGPESESPSDVAAYAAPGLLTVMSSDAWDDYRIPVAPYFVLVDGRRGVVVGEGAADSWDLVQRLLAKAVADGGYTPGRPSRRDVLLGRTRAERIDRDLRAAGITPGSPELYHRAATDEPESR